MSGTVSPFKRAAVAEQSARRMISPGQASSKRVLSPSFAEQSSRRFQVSEAKLLRRRSTIRVDDLQGKGPNMDGPLQKPSFIREDAAGLVRGTVFKMVKSSNGAVKWKERDATLMLGSGLLTLSSPSQTGNNPAVDTAADLLAASDVAEQMQGGATGQSATVNSNTIITAKQITHAEHPWIMELRFSPESSSAERNRSSEVVWVLGLRDGQGRDEWVQAIRQIGADKELLLDKYMQYYDKQKAREMDHFETTKAEPPEEPETEASETAAPNSADTAQRLSKSSQDSEELGELWMALQAALEVEGTLEASTLRRILLEAGVNLNLEDASVLRDEMQKSPGRLDQAVFRRAVSKLPLATKGQGSIANAKMEATMHAKMSLEAFRDENMSDEEWGEFLATEVERAKRELHIPVMHGPVDHPSRYLEHGHDDDHHSHDHDHDKDADGWAGQGGGQGWQGMERRDSGDNAYADEFESEGEEEMREAVSSSTFPEAAPQFRHHAPSRPSVVITDGRSSGSPGKHARGVGVSRLHGAYPQSSRSPSSTVGGGVRSKSVPLMERREPAAAPTSGEFRKVVSKHLVDLYRKFPATGSFLQDQSDTAHSNTMLLTRRLPTIDTRANIRRSMIPLISDSKEYLYLTPATLPRPRPQVGKKSPDLSQRFNATADAISRIRSMQASNAPLDATFRL